MKKLILAIFFSTCSLWVHAEDKSLTLPTGTLVVYASQPGEAVMDGVIAVDKNSPFTGALLENLKNPEDINFVLRKVRQKVMEVTAQAQQPVTIDTYTPGSLVLARLNNGYPKKLQAQAWVVGNAKYQNILPLNNSGNDAKAISELLKSLNFSVTTSLDRSKSELISDLAKFQENAQKSDITLFFFAGHGVRIEGVNYLLPVDVTANSAASLADGSLSVPGIMNNFPGNTRLFLIDADSDNPFASKSSR